MHLISTVKFTCLSQSLKNYHSCEHSCWFTLVLGLSFFTSRYTMVHLKMEGLSSIFWWVLASFLAPVSSWMEANELTPINIQDILFSLISGLPLPIAGTNLTLILVGLWEDTCRWAGRRCWQRLAGRFCFKFTCWHWIWTKTLIRTY